MEVLGGGGGLMSDELLIWMDLILERFVENENF